MHGCNFAFLGVTETIFGEDEGDEILLNLRPCLSFAEVMADTISSLKIFELVLKQ